VQVSYVDELDDKDFLESDEEDWEKGGEEEEEEESESDEEFMSRRKVKSKGGKESKEDAETAKKPVASGANAATATTVTNVPNTNMAYAGAHMNMSPTGHMAAHSNTGHMNATKQGGPSSNFTLPPAHSWSTPSNFPNSATSPYLSDPNAISDPRRSSMQAAQAVSYTAQMPAMQMPSSQASGMFYYVNGVQYVAGSGGGLVPTGRRSNNGV
jgi:hypothetical protein